MLCPRDKRTSKAEDVPDAPIKYLWIRGGGQVAPRLSSLAELPGTAPH